MSSAFDRVVVREADGNTNEMSRDQYRALPLKVRVRMLVEGKVTFFSGSREVAASEAIKSA